MTTDLDLDKLDKQATQAEQRAVEARATIREAMDADAARRTELETEWNRRYVASYDVTVYQQEIAAARAAVEQAIHDTPLGAALLRLGVAERVADSERRAVASAARLVGDGSHGDPAAGARQLTDPLSLITTVIGQMAEAESRRREAERNASFERYGSDSGRITVAANHREVILCGACTKPVAPDDIYRSAHDVAFHNSDACRPRVQFPEAKTLAEEEAERVRFRKLYGDWA